MSSFDVETNRKKQCNQEKRNIKEMDLVLMDKIFIYLCENPQMKKTLQKSNNKLL